MIRSIIWFFEFIISLILSIPFLMIAKYKLGKYGKREAAEFAYRFSSVWVKPKIALSGAKVTVTGLENIPLGEKITFISNHQSNFDIAMIMKYVPGAKGFVAKKEMEAVPILSSWMKLMGCVFIDRNSPRQSVTAIVDAINNVKDGINMVVFPEGSRSKGKPIGEFKMGSFKIAMKSKAVIVPITIDGTYKLMEEENRVRAGSVKIIVHPPIYVEKLDNEEKNKINIIVRDIIVNGMGK